MIDDLKRAREALAPVRGRGTKQKAIESLDVLLGSVRSTLRRLGIEEIDAYGSTFDPSNMEAVARDPSGQHPPGTVSGQVATGFRRGQRLLQPARVAVAVNPDDD